MIIILQIGPEKKSKISSYPSFLTFVLDAQIIEVVLLSIPNICFGLVEN